MKCQQLADVGAPRPAHCLALVFMLASMLAFAGITRRWLAGSGRICQRSRKWRNQVRVFLHATRLRLFTSSARRSEQDATEAMDEALIFSISMDGVSVFA
jgi:hypothetical protein